MFRTSFKVTIPWLNSLGKQLWFWRVSQQLEMQCVIIKSFPEYLWSITNDPYGSGYNHTEWRDRYLKERQLWFRAIERGLCPKGVRPPILK